MFLPQRGRMSAQLTGEGEIAGCFRFPLALLRPSPSSAPVCALGHLPPLGEGQRAAEGVPTREKHPGARETLDVPSSAATFQALLRRSKLCSAPTAGRELGRIPPALASSGHPPLGKGGLPDLRCSSLRCHPEEALPTKDLVGVGFIGIRASTGFAGDS